MPSVGTGHFSLKSSSADIIIPALTRTSCVVVASGLWDGENSIVKANSMLVFPNVPSIPSWKDDPVSCSRPLLLRANDEAFSLDHRLGMTTAGLILSKWSLVPVATHSCQLGFLFLVVLGTLDI